MSQIIYVGNDHAGVKKKKLLLAFLIKKGFSVIDLGSTDEYAKDDYVDFASAVSNAVVKSNGSAKGILLCGSGTGMVIAANKHPGIRAGLCYDTYTAKMARQDNDANILCLRSRGVSFSKLESVITTWLNTPFSNLARHKKRIAKLEVQK